jgi:hypothetical protein
MRERKRQRIRDPLHGLIEFDEGNPFERMLWRVIKTRSFQRLRRIRQLGFSDLVYPGATHSRFAHSLGVFHTAQKLMTIINPSTPNERLSAEAAMAAALVHDVGHGPFSHAFEVIGEAFGWKLAGEHENHSEALIRCRDPGAIGAELDRHDNDFADLVADAVRGGPSTIFQSVVSSQFDADRLDYVRRDRLMTGTGLAAIDFDWLLTNLEIGELPGDGLRRQTFVLGSKAVHAAEGFVIGLFQMYPTVYFHKTTRGAEKLAQAALKRVFDLALAGDWTKTGLPETHPLIRVTKTPDDLAVLADLDDTVVLGALVMLRAAADPLLAGLSERLQNRNLFGAIDLIRDGQIREFGEAEFLRKKDAITDAVTRKPYKPVEEEGAMNQIWIRDGGGLVDLRLRSKTVDAIEPYRAFRAYIAKDDEEARRFVEGVVTEVMKEARS